MNPSLSTQMHRALYALPLLVVGLAGAMGVETLPTVPAAPAAPTTVVVVLATPAGGVASTLPGAPAGATTLAMEAVPGVDCGATRAVGTRGLARMPGDLTTLAVRMRCAQ